MNIVVSFGFVEILEIIFRSFWTFAGIFLIITGAIAAKNGL